MVDPDAALEEGQDGHHLREGLVLCFLVLVWGLSMRRMV